MKRGKGGDETLTTAVTYTGEWEMGGEIAYKDESSWLIEMHDALTITREKLRAARTISISMNVR